jgi:transposase-like protein
MHFTQIRRRTLKIKACVEDTNFTDEPMLLVVDASGLTMSRKGDYIEEKWRRNKKEFIKLHIAVDAKTKEIVSFRITKGNVHDSKKFIPLVREAFERCSNIQKVYADKGHDNRKNFNLLDELNAEPAIGIRNNASTRSRGCHLRTEKVLRMKRSAIKDGNSLRMQG